mmetsp:Transcript_4512/g.18382  ORF Transcript_4512/g.18382 Transcript_4512/m.18382 type:complete len:220 (+) Transcript_4512:851-1510(+)
MGAAWKRRHPHEKSTGSRALRILACQRCRRTRQSAYGSGCPGATSSWSRSPPTRSGRLLSKVRSKNSAGTPSMRSLTYAPFGSPTTSGVAAAPSSWIRRSARRSRSCRALNSTLFGSSASALSAALRLFCVSSASSSDEAASLLARRRARAAPPRSSSSGRRVSTKARDGTGRDTRAAVAARRRRDSADEWRQDGTLPDGRRPPPRARSSSSVRRCAAP